MNAEMLAEKAIVRTISMACAANNGMTQVGHVSSRLMFAAGLWFQF